MKASDFQKQRAQEIAGDPEKRGYYYLSEVEGHWMSIKAIDSYGETSHKDKDGNPKPFVMVIADVANGAEVVEHKVQVTGYYVFDLITAYFAGERSVEEPLEGRPVKDFPFQGATQKAWVLVD